MLFLTSLSETDSSVLTSAEDILIVPTEWHLKPNLRGNFSFEGFFMEPTGLRRIISPPNHAYKVLAVGQMLFSLRVWKLCGIFRGIFL